MSSVSTALSSMREKRLAGKELSTTSPDDDNSTLRRAELQLRNEVDSNPLQLLLKNSYASVVVFVFYLVSLESLISIALTIGMTIYTYNRVDDRNEFTTFNGSTISWVLLTFVTITPMSASIAMAFRRRDEALMNIARMHAVFSNIYSSHALWDWGWESDGSTGRSRSTIDWLQHSDQVLVEILGICDALTRILTLPNSSRARHKITGKGHDEALRIKELTTKLNQSIVLRFGEISKLEEVLKGEGLPAQEATRVRMWERSAHEYFEFVRVVKTYRTPQALRSFSRLFSVFLPPLYAPYYSQMAHKLNSLGAALAFATFTSIALTSLFETVSQLEDPFVPGSVLDGIQVRNNVFSDYVKGLTALRSIYFPQADTFVNPYGEGKLPRDSTSPLQGRILSE